MAIAMQSSQGDAQGFEAEAGTYIFKLIGITVDEGSEYEDRSKTYPQARFVWEDEEGDRFYDSFIRIPLGFRLNPKAKWTNRLAALVGRPVGDADAPKLLIDLGASVGNYDQLAQAVKSGSLEANELSYDGQSLFGRQVQLTLGTNARGYNTCGAGGASPLPSASGKKRKSEDTPRFGPDGMPF